MRLVLALCAALAACSGDRAGEAPAEQAVREAVRQSEADTGQPAPATAAATPPTERGTGTCGRPVVDGDGIGAIRIGSSVDLVKTSCAVARDTMELDTEGQREQLLIVPFGGDTARVEVNDGRVWRIEITSPGLRTADWVGVGTPLSTLLAQQGGVQGLTGEGNLFLISEARCGLSFELSEPRSPSGDWSAARLRTLPKSTTVTRVLIVGCQNT